MAARRDQHTARHAPRADRRRWTVALATGLWLCALVLAAAAQGPGEPPPPPRAEAPGMPRAALRDSLRHEIKRYARVVQSLRDSMLSLEREGELGREQERVIEQTIAELSGSLTELSHELANLDVEFTGEAIAIRDGQGGTISITVPKDLGEQISRGISSITQVILDELPDTLSVRSPVWISSRDRAKGLADSVRSYSWNLRDEAGTVPRAPRVFSTRRRPSRVIEGDIVKIRDDLVIEADEVVRGNVVVVMGNALVDGRIDGDLISVVGDMQLGENAEVGGQVVSVLGRFDRMDGAEVGSVVVVNPGGLFDLDGLEWGVEGGGWKTFLAWQGAFLMLALLAILVLAFVPAARLDSVQAALATRPLECFGLGLLVTLAGHGLLAVLMAVLVLTVIGIPLAILLLLGLLLLDVIAVAVVAVAVGRRLCAALSLSCSRPWVMALLGLVAIHSVSFVSGAVASVTGGSAVAGLLGLIGISLKVLVYVFGLGSLVVSRGGRRRAEAPDSVLEPASV